LAEAKSRPGPWLNKGWEPLGKHFPFAVRIPASELAHDEQELDPAAYAGRIT